MCYLCKSIINKNVLKGQQETIKNIISVMSPILLDIWDGPLVATS